MVLCSGHRSGALAVWELDRLAPLGVPERLGAGVSALAFHQDGGAIFAATSRTLRAFALDTRLACRDAVPVDWDRIAQLSTDAQRLTAASIRGTHMQVWELPLDPAQLTALSDELDDTANARIAKAAETERQTPPVVAVTAVAAAAAEPATRPAVRALRPGSAGVRAEVPGARTKRPAPSDDPFRPRLRLGTRCECYVRRPGCCCCCAPMLMPAAAAQSRAGRCTRDSTGCDTGATTTAGCAAGRARLRSCCRWCRRRRRACRRVSLETAGRARCTHVCAQNTPGRAAARSQATGTGRPVRRHRCRSRYGR